MLPVAAGSHFDLGGAAACSGGQGWAVACYSWTRHAPRDKDGLILKLVGQADCADKEKHHCGAAVATKPCRLHPKDRFTPDLNAQRAPPPFTPPSTLCAPPYCGASLAAPNKASATFTLQPQSQSMITVCGRVMRKG